MKLKKYKPDEAKLVEASNGLVVGRGQDAVIFSVQRVIQPVIPSDFHWWLEVDADSRCSVRWVWLGHSAVNYIGGISDQSVSILIQLLKIVNWHVERQHAVESVEGYEEQALKAAQQMRRAKLAGTKLAPIILPESPPIGIETKRVVHRASVARAGYRAALEEQKRRQEAQAAIVPKTPEIRSYYDCARLPVPEQGLTRSKGYRRSDWRWIAFSERQDTMEALIAEPPGTFTHICVHGIIGDNVEAWRRSWIETRPIREIQSAIFKYESEGRDAEALYKKLHRVIRRDVVAMRDKPAS